MIPPYELKNKEFSSAFKGYSKAEVDEYFAFLIEKYTELYRENDALSRKLAETEERLSELSKKEDAIRHVLVNSKNAAQLIEDDAKRKSDAIIEAAKESCTEIINNFREQIKIEIDTLTLLRAQVLEFRARMFSEYQKHIELIKNITPGDMGDGFSLSPTEYAAKVLQKTRADIKGKKRPVTRKENEEGAALEKAIRMSVDEMMGKKPGESAADTPDA